jgi:aspartokinase
MADHNLTAEEHNEIRRAQKQKQKANARKGSASQQREERKESVRFAPAYSAEIADKALIEDHLYSKHEVLTHRTIYQKFQRDGIILKILTADQVPLGHEDPIEGKLVSAEPDGFYLLSDTGSKVSIPFTRRIFVRIHDPFGFVFNRIKLDDGTLKVLFY